MKRILRQVDGRRGCQDRLGLEVAHIAQGTSLTLAESAPFICRNMCGVENDNVRSSLTCYFLHRVINNVVAALDWAVQSQCGFSWRPTRGRVRRTILRLWLKSDE